MTSRSKSKHEEALQFLDDLDSFAPTPEGSDPSTANSDLGRGTAAAGSTSSEGEAEVLAFLDEITQKSAEPTRSTTSHLDRPISRSGTPTLRKSTERVKLGGPSLLLSASSSSASLPKTATTAADGGPVRSRAEQVGSAEGGTVGGWGWGSVWSSASAAIQQAKSAVDEQVKYLPKNEQARKWGEGVIEYAKAAQLDKLGQDFKRVGLSTLTDILNVVAPPISEHEVIQVWLSHDMRGYEGIESLVYRALARIMEQVEGGDLVVNRGEESRPKESGEGGRDLNAVDGYDAAIGLAQANLEEMIKNNTQPSQPKLSSTQSPTTYSHVYLRVQPFLVSYSIPSLLSEANHKSATTGEAQVQQHLQFLLHLVDPVHQLAHTTITQAVPSQWLGIWDEYEWVEDLVAEALRVGVEVLGQEYVVARMGWGGHDKEGRSSKVEDGEDKDGEKVEQVGTGEES